MMKFEINFLSIILKSTLNYLILTDERGMVQAGFLNSGMSMPLFSLIIFLGPALLFGIHQLYWDRSVLLSGCLRVRIVFKHVELVCSATSEIVIDAIHLVLAILASLIIYI
jgi:hypothetical protein